MIYLNMSDPGSSCHLILDTLPESSKRCGLKERQMDGTLVIPVLPLLFAILHIVCTDNPMLDGGEHGGSSIALVAVSTLLLGFVRN